MDVATAQARRSSAVRASVAQTDASILNLISIDRLEVAFATATLKTDRLGETLR